MRRLNWFACLLTILLITAAPAAAQQQVRVYVVNASGQWVPWTGAPGTLPAGSVAITSQVPGVGATNLGKAEDAAHATADTGVSVLCVRNEAGAQISNADADYTPCAVDAFGVLYTRQDHPKRIRCVVVVSTATTVQAVGTSCVAPGAGLSIYITDVSFGTSAAAGTAADSFPTLKYGTGGTCGVGTAVVWQALTTANSTVTENLSTPIKIPANNELCWIMTTAGSKTLQINGYIAP